MNNLWGDITVFEEIDTPKDIIEEQASIFNGIKGNLASINVSKRILTNSGKKVFQSYKDDYDVDADFIYSFELESQLLADYSYEVFTIYYGIKFYPLCISLSNGIADELGDYLDKSVELLDWDEHRYIVENEAGFTELLGMILTTKELAVIIRNMNILAKEQMDAKDTVEIE